MLLTCLSVGALVPMAQMATDSFPEAAQASGPIPDWLLDSVFLGWSLGALVGAYLFAVLFTLVFMGRFYPPNVARLGFWLGLTAWLSVLAFVILPRVAAVELPVWVIIALTALVLLTGVILLATRRQPSY